MVHDPEETSPSAPFEPSPHLEEERAPVFTPAAADVEEEAFSHGGLVTVDPWSRERAADGQRTVRFMGGLVETLDVLVLALAMFLCVRFVAHNYVVEGGSMLPTFHQSDLVIVNRLVYREFDLSWIPGLGADEWRPFGTPAPGDVVVFEYAGDPNQRDFIKRVIAVPGQTVQVQGGVVIVDGEALDEPYIAEAPRYDYPPTVVQPGTLFVLGDNRNNSMDSHVFGLVDASTVIGRADFRYWPADRWGMIGHVLGDGASIATRLGVEWGTGLAAAWR
ncbi:MAG: signal peptidase I [Dehalococcoidia bacterium]|nr:signal peptidase I [Dehalococcoidia bacterium]